MKKTKIYFSNEKHNNEDIVFRYVFKNQSVLMRIIGKVFKHFYEMVPTSIGRTIYLPVQWEVFSDSVKEIILLHEKAHMKQQQRCGWVAYMLLITFIFPILYCPFRLHWEKEAWEDTIHQTAVRHRAGLLEDEGFQWFVSQESLFYTIRSGWMWKDHKAVHEWLCSTIQKEMWPYIQLTKEEIYSWI